MSIARGIAKAAKAQARGLEGKRNSQGDFMPEEVQMKGVQDSVTPDLQNYIEDVKVQIDEIDTRSSKLPQNDYESLMENLVYKEELLDDLIKKLDEEGVEVPPQLATAFNDTQSQIIRLHDELGPEFGNDMANREPEPLWERDVY